MPTDLSGAVPAFDQLLREGFEPKNLGELYDTLKLMGVIVGYFALLDTASRAGDDKARVTAARALTSLKEDPEQIAERLRRSQFAEFSLQDLNTAVQRLKTGESLTTVVTSIRQESTNVRPQSQPV